MKHRSLDSVLSFLACLSIVSGCKPSDSHPHEQSPSMAAELEPETKTVFGERTLLFMENPPLVRGSRVRFLAHLTVCATGEPVRAGKVRLEVGSTVLVADVPKRDGLFVPEGVFTEPGTHRARLSVVSEQVEETLDLGEVHVYPDEQTARRAAIGAAEEARPNEVPFLMEQQWRVKLLLAQASAQVLSKRLTIPAVAMLPEGAAAIVSPPTSGRLHGPISGRLPRTGERVEQGQLLGMIEPPLTASDLAQLQALSLDLDLKVLDTARAVSEAEVRVRFAERERGRLAHLREEGLSTKPQLEQAEQNLTVALSDGEAARAMKESLDRLIADRAARDQGAAPATVRLPLRAPIAGTIVATGHVEGESVTQDATLFRILDSSRLWIEGRASEFDLPQVRKTPTAEVSFPAMPGLRIELSEAAVSSAYIAPTIEAASRTFSIRYEVPNPGGELKSGMLAQLALATEEVAAVVVIPADAVIMEQGLPTAYVMLSGETFERRDLELGLRDGAQVEVRRGISAGERVATRGSYLIKLAALSPASFGAGHAH
ncbi:MAG: efflux RND transporter periplasmic adaptor subunit [Planctomycetes bacterium]|nr:efflux RND transporter periplasmic adaptor subunit [Planctomycetota bacterium]